MRKLVLSVLTFVLAAGIASANAGEPATVAAINAASAALDDAFERQSAEDIKRMMTADHIAVTPYYETPQTAAAQIASLPELKYKQTNTGEVKVVVLGPDAGMRTFTARLDGTYKGKTIPPDVFVTSIMVREDGQWREKFYQVTALQP
ncbi:MAG: nuclear transport factor 2 family protein [Methyloceanibacter sp.]